MPSTILFSILLLGLVSGCPHHQVHVADVTTKTTAISDALVVVHCDDAVHVSDRTNKEGRAALKIYRATDPQRCQVVVAKPGFETIEKQGAALCPEGKTCPRTRYVLRRVGDTK